ncbi:MAG TPA: aldo/keto reductase [Anaerolineaceae bacterium]
MEKRKFGKTGMEVTALGYGAMELRHLQEESESLHLLNQVLDLGINYIDTSPDYGPSEDLIGKAISQRREAFFLATKCGCNIDAEGRHLDPAHIWTRKKLQENLETSLRRLKTDHIDVWQIHAASPGDLPGGRTHEVIQTMLDFKAQGKVGAIGISFRNGRAGDALYPAGYGYEAFQPFLEFGVFDMMQIVYGGMVRVSENAITRAADLGLGMVIRGVVKPYFPNFAEMFRAAGLDSLCEPNETMSTFLVRFALNHPGLHTMIIGTKNPAHLLENIRAVEMGRLPEDIYQEAIKRLDQAGITASPV